MPLTLTLSVDFATQWDASRALSTIPTLQVVTSPLLDESFQLGLSPRGHGLSSAAAASTRRNPVYEAVWQSLRDLGASHVRYQPWFPQPHKAIAAIRPPTSNRTYWDFGRLLPQFLDFLKHASQGRPTLLNFATFPCWLFAHSTGNQPPRENELDCTPPLETANPDGAAYWYANRGERSRLRDSSGRELAEYFSRLFAYLSVGSFEDEYGSVVGGGPAVGLTRAKGHIWEVFNEQEHSYNAVQYTNDYDEVVGAIVRRVGWEQVPSTGKAPLNLISSHL